MTKRHCPSPHFTSFCYFDSFCNAFFRHFFLFFIDLRYHAPPSRFRLHRESKGNCNELKKLVHFFSIPVLMHLFSSSKVELYFHLVSLIYKFFSKSGFYLKI